MTTSSPQRRDVRQRIKRHVGERYGNLRGRLRPQATPEALHMPAEEFSPKEPTNTEE